MHSRATSTARRRSRPRPRPYRPASSPGGRSGGGSGSLRGLRSRRGGSSSRASSSSTPGMSFWNRMVSSETSVPSSANICWEKASAFSLRCRRPAWRGGVSSSGNSSTLSVTGAFRGVSLGGGGASSSGSPAAGASSSSPPSASSSSGGAVMPGKSTTFWGGGVCLASGQGRSGPGSAAGLSFPSSSQRLTSTPYSAKISSRVKFCCSSSLSFAIPAFLCSLNGYPSRWRTAS